MKTNLKPHYLCIDLGGTKIQGAILDTHGHCHTEKRIEQHGIKAPDEPQPLYDFIDDMLRNTDKCIAGLSLGVAGIVSGGLIADAPAFGWYNYPLQQRLQSRYQLPVVLENDVNCAVLGESSLYPDASILCYLAIGTGIGLGTSIDGRLLRGAHGGAGEIGRSLSSVQELNVPHPAFGSMERAASGTAILRAIADNFEGDAPAAFAAYEKGNERARAALTPILSHIAMLLISIATIIDPDIIILGGGVAKSLGPFADELAAIARRKTRFDVDVRTSQLHERATLLGCLKNIKSQS